VANLRHLCAALLPNVDKPAGEYHVGTQFDLDIFKSAVPEVRRVFNVSLCLPAKYFYTDEFSCAIDAFNLAVGKVCRICVM
jgi:hypothetical protein